MLKWTKKVKNNNEKMIKKASNVKSAFTKVIVSIYLSTTNKLPFIRLLTLCRMHGNKIRLHYTLPYMCALCSVLCTLCTRVVEYFQMMRLYCFTWTLVCGWVWPEKEHNKISVHSTSFFPLSLYLSIYKYV